MDFAAPRLEMLWEGGDPREALETRFGFSDAAAAGRWVVTMADGHWGVQVESCDRIVISDHNALAWVARPSGRMLAKWSVATARFPRLAGLARLIAWLDARSLPVSAPIATVDGRVQLEADGASLGFQREIDGDHLDTAVPRQVRSAGAVLARLHDALAAYPDADQVPGLGVPSTSLGDRIHGWIDSCPAHVPPAARDVLRRLVSRAHSGSFPTQIVHGDYRASNILCTAAGVVSVIDFEEARFDHRIVELARSAVGEGRLGTVSLSDRR